MTLDDFQEIHLVERSINQIGDDGFLGSSDTESHGPAIRPYLFQIFPKSVFGVLFGHPHLIGWKSWSWCADPTQEVEHFRVVRHTGNDQPCLDIRPTVIFTVGRRDWVVCRHQKPPSSNRLSTSSNGGGASGASIDAKKPSGLRSGLGSGVGVPPSKHHDPSVVGCPHIPDFLDLSRDLSWR